MNLAFIFQNRETGVNLNSPRTRPGTSCSSEPVAKVASNSVRGDKPVCATPPRPRISGFIEVTPGGHVIPAAGTRSPERSDLERPRAATSKKGKKDSEAAEDLPDLPPDEWKMLKVTYFVQD